jgi:hypothetical protein
MPTVEKLRETQIPRYTPVRNPLFYHFWRKVSENWEFVLDQKRGFIKTPVPPCLLQIVRTPPLVGHSPANVSLDSKVASSIAISADPLETVDPRLLTLAAHYFSRSVRKAFWTKRPIAIPNTVLAV